MYFAQSLYQAFLYCYYNVSLYAAFISKFSVEGSLETTQTFSHVLAYHPTVLGFLFAQFRNIKSAQMFLCSYSM